MKVYPKIRFLFLFLCLGSGSLWSQCLNEPGIIWMGQESTISFAKLAHYAAPMLWFSPDEIKLYNEQGEKQIPQPFPFDKPSETPVVYYKYRYVYGRDVETIVLNRQRVNPDLLLLNLKDVVAIDLDFYYYFREETGPTAHLHDVESIALQIQVVEALDCPDYRYAIKVSKVTGRAHGIHWYNNTMRVDAQTFFPLSILIEEGKHASCTDKNADGTYTPTYDVTERINDAWGIRDIITSGRLVSGGFQAWMAKSRDPSSLLFPPIPEDSPHYKGFVDKFRAFFDGPPYELRPYPDYRKEKEAGNIEKKLDRFMRSKTPHRWPRLQRATGKKPIKQWLKEEKSYRSLSLAYRFDDANGLSFTFPLLIFKNVEAPKTGGWLYNKVYFGDQEAILNNSNLAFEQSFGHQITYSSSASRWFDGYMGIGYELFDTDLDPKATDFEPFMVSEIGMKFRVNVNRTPLKFLRHLGTNFWGIKAGWKNIGFSPFVYSGFVIEIGAGVF